MNVVTIGILSDTHRHLPEGALEVLRGNYEDDQVQESVALSDSGEKIEKAPASHIIHAGDIGNLWPLTQNIIDSLEKIAPVMAVLGNMDVEGYIAGDELVSEQMLTAEICGVSIAVAHRPEDLHAAILKAGIDPRVKIHGHTHVPRLERRGDGLVICPGALHRPRGEWPLRTVALLHLVDPGTILRADIVRI